MSEVGSSSAPGSDQGSARGQAPRGSSSRKITAHLEITSGIIRLYRSGGYQDGTPFLFDLHLVGDDRTAILKGLKADHDAFGRSYMRAVNDCLKEYGFLRAEWDRCRSGSGMMVVQRVGFPIR